MRRIAFLISSNMLPRREGARADRYELDLELGALRPPCALRLMALEPVVWDAAGVDWAAYDAAVIGTTWDYWSQPERFLKGLEAIEAAGTRLFNAAADVRWNIDKIYLKDLARRGAPLAPTLWAERADAETLAGAFDALGADDLVVKPRVGAGAHRLARIRRGEAPPPAERLPKSQCLIQPYLASVAARGELSFMFYDGVFSHAARKIPAAGDFRVQSLYGAKEVDHDPTPGELEAAHAALAALGKPLLYARVDMAAGLDGAPVLMELEIIEPYHYPEQGPACGAHFAAALDRYLA